jgi:hypothetical protein
MEPRPVFYGGAVGVLPHHLPSLLKIENQKSIEEESSSYYLLVSSSSKSFN